MKRYRRSAFHLTAKKVLGNINHLAHQRDSPIRDTAGRQLPPEVTDLLQLAQVPVLLLDALHERVARLLMRHIVELLHLLLILTTEDRPSESYTRSARQSGMSGGTESTPLICTRRRGYRSNSQLPKDGIVA